MEDLVLWNATIDEMTKGYIHNKKDEHYTCLICGKVFDENEVFTIDDKYYNAKKYISFHIETEHGDMFSYLTNLDKKYTGLTQTQKKIMNMMIRGLDDQAISEACGSSKSTIRNYRFQFKEKEKQAKIQYAIYNMLNKGIITKANRKFDNFIEFHPGVKIIDERFAITEKEYGEVIKTYIIDGKLKQFPTKHKRKIIILKFISSLLKKDKKYTEKEINNLISSVYDDYATIKRYMIEYGFIEREKDCSYYWLKNGGIKNDK